MKVLVTGAGGFLGLNICKILIKKYEVINFSRHHHSELDELGITTRKGSLRDPESIKKALADIDAVFHVAAIAGVWGKEEDFVQTNEIGTKSLVKACLDCSIKYFVYTSSPSVVFEKEDIILGDETLSYPKTFLNHYGRTKANAEKHVLESSSEKFQCVALRPHLIWGPKDPHILPRLIQKSKAGKLKQVGDGDNLVDIIYVENAAMAHVLAFEKLLTDSTLSGNSYFIGQERPVKLWDFINQLLVSAGEDLVETSVSFKTAYRAGWLLEKVFSFFGITKPEPPMTRFVACQLAKSHYFSHEKAHKDFGYTPSVSIEEGLMRTFKERNESLEMRKF
jgi:nucleoside-diphosphate-sugar epimerase